MITAGIVDDKFYSRNVIKLILENYCKEVSIVGMADNFDSAVEMIHTLRPNLMFLDIAMPTGNGFDLAVHCNAAKSKVVFVSGHTDRGIEAFQSNALYYIGKPVRIPEIQAAVQKYKKYFGDAPVPFDRDRLGGAPIDQLVLSSVDGFRLIPYRQIKYIECDGSYSKIHLQEEEPILHAQLLKELATSLPHPRFLRIHRSYILHSAFVAKVAKSYRGGIELRDGTMIPVGKDYMDDIRRHLIGMTVD